jgi:hypothetical protein
MKKLTLISIICFTLMSVRVFSQAIGIGASVFTPDASAMLEVQATNKGILIPRVALTQTTSSSPITSPATSLMVYNTATVNDVTPGYYYWDGTKWVRLLDGSSSSDGWLTLGNAGTNPATHFVGTTDSVDLVFRTNNTEKMRIAADGNVGIGTTSPAQKLDISGNVQFSGALMPAGNAGTSGQVLVSQGAGTAPQWQNLSNLTGFWKLLYVDAWNSSSTSNLGWNCPTCDGPAPYLTTCGTVRMLGGYGMCGTGDYFEKTFTGLPPHTEVMVEAFWWSVDSWDQWDGAGVDLIALSIDGTEVSRATPYEPGTSSVSVRASDASVCGASNWVDIGPQLIVGWSAHTAANVTVRITNLANQGSTDESMGIVMVRLWVK